MMSYPKQIFYTREFREWLYTKTFDAENFGRSDYGKYSEMERMCQFSAAKAYKNVIKELNLEDEYSRFKLDCYS